MNLQPALLQMNLYCTVLTAKTTLIPSVLHTILLVMLLRTVCVRPTGASRVSPPPPLPGWSWSLPCQNITELQQKPTRVGDFFLFLLLSADRWWILFSPTPRRPRTTSPGDGATSLPFCLLLFLWIYSSSGRLKTIKIKGRGSTRRRSRERGDRKAGHQSKRLLVLPLHGQSRTCFRELVIPYR